MGDRRTEVRGTEGQRYRGQGQRHGGQRDRGMADRGIERRGTEVRKQRRQGDTGRGTGERDTEAWREIPGAEMRLGPTLWLLNCSACCTRRMGPVGLSLCLLGNSSSACCILAEEPATCGT